MAIYRKNNNQLTLLLSIIILILSRFPASDHEQDILKTDHLRLSIEEKKLNIEKLKKELDAGKVNENTMDAVTNEINRNPKITARKSNFYRNLVGYEKVTGLGVVSLNDNNLPITDEHFISRSDFNKFLINRDQLPIETVENAEIKIISPCPRRG